jgi:hypothetical protein
MQEQIRGFHHSATDDEPVCRSGRNDNVQLCRVLVLALDGFGLGADCVLDVLRG